MIRIHDFPSFLPPLHSPVSLHACRCSRAAAAAVEAARTERRYSVAGACCLHRRLRRRDPVASDDVVTRKRFASQARRRDREVCSFLLLRPLSLHHLPAYPPSIHAGIIKSLSPHLVDDRTRETREEMKEQETAVCVHVSVSEWEREGCRWR